MRDGNLVRAGLNYKFDFLQAVPRSSRDTEVERLPSFQARDCAWKLLD